MQVETSPHDGDWDAIVIGSGLGGLTTAAYLATNGLRTLVLEQYDVVGGCSHVFRRKRQFEFDVGLHYIGDCGPDGVIPTTLRGVGLEGRIEFQEMDPDGFDTLVFPELTFRVPRGWDRYLQRLIEAFPEQEAGLRRCVDVLERVPRELRGSPSPSSEGELEEFVRSSPTVVEWGLRTLDELFDDCGLSRSARAVVAGQSGDHATPASRVAVAVHAGLMDHYIRGGSYYPKGGGQVLAAHLVDVIRSHGSSVRTQARVARIVVADGAVSGVELGSGEAIEAPVVVSNADIKRTFLELLDPVAVSAEARERAAGYRMAVPLFCVYLGLDIDLAETLPNTNYWAHASDDPEAIFALCGPRSAGELEIDPQALSVYITSATLKDPGNEHVAPPGCSSLELMTLVPFDYALWGIEDGPAAGERYRRKGEYLKLKRRLTEALIERAEQVIPEIHGHVVWQEASTPITQERYTLSSDGASYGLELTADQVGPNRPGARTEVEGLFLAGASTVWGHGIAGVMRGGVGTASAVLDRDLYAQVIEGEVFGDPSKLTAGGPGWDPWLASRRLSVKPRRRRAPAPSPA